MTRGLLRFDDERARQAERQYQSPEVAHQRAELRRLLELSPGERLLDVGCGPALQTVESMPALGPAGSAFGVDISPTMLASAKARAAGSARAAFCSGRAESLPFASGAFDAAVATQVYEYVTPLDEALRELCRVLRPGGRAVILDTDWDTLAWRTQDSERMRRILRAWEDHLVHPRLPRELPARLRRAGLELERELVIPFANAECHEGTYSYWLIGFVVDFLSSHPAIERGELNDWEAELRELARRGRYSFRLDRHIFLARRPQD